jgi:hypothetical protein
MSRTKKLIVGTNKHFPGLHLLRLREELEGEDEGTAPRTAPLARTLSVL